MSTETTGFNWEYAPAPEAIDHAKIKKQYENKISLPSSLAIDMVECKSNCCVKV